MKVLISNAKIQNINLWKTRITIKLKAILGIKFTAQTAGAHSRLCRNGKQVRGRPKPKA